MYYHIILYMTHKESNIQNTDVWLHTRTKRGKIFKFFFHVPLFVGTTSRDIAYIFSKSSLNLYLFCGHLIFAFNLAELAKRNNTYFKLQKCFLCNFLDSSESHRCPQAHLLLVLKDL
jgi:hypothetical protein